MSAPPIHHVGPCTIPCAEKCEVPEGVTMAEVPIPRHAWGDVFVCPNGCGRALMLLEREAAT